MCGIVGVLSYRESGLLGGECRSLHNLVMANIVRGADGSGILWQPTKSKEGDAYAYWHKEAKSAGEVFSRLTLEATLEDARFAVTHNRAATLGKLTDEHTHPFSFGSVIGVHNGTISSWRTLPGVDKAEMDSQAVIEAISKADTDEDSVIKVLDACDAGAYALVWYDNRIKALRIARNNDRPMNFMLTDTALWFGSELEMLEWGLGRGKERYRKAISLQENTLVTIPIDGSAPTYQTYHPTYVNTSYGMSRQFDYPSYQRGGRLRDEWPDAWQDAWDYDGSMNDYVGSRSSTKDPGVIIVDSVQALPELETASAGTRMCMYNTIKKALNFDLISVSANPRADLETVIYEMVRESLQQSDILEHQYYSVDDDTKTAFVRPTIVSLHRAEMQANGFVRFGKYVLPVSISLDSQPQTTINKIGAALARNDLPLFAPCAISALNLYATGDWGWMLWAPTTEVDGIEDKDVETRATVDITRALIHYGADNPNTVCHRVYYKADWDKGWSQVSA